MPQDGRLARRRVGKRSLADGRNVNLSGNVAQGGAGGAGGGGEARLFRFLGGRPRTRPGLPSGTSSGIFIERRRREICRSDASLRIAGGRSRRPGVDRARSRLGRSVGDDLLRRRRRGSESNKQSQAYNGKWTRTPQQSSARTERRNCGCRLEGRQRLGGGGAFSLCGVVKSHEEK